MELYAILDRRVIRPENAIPPLIIEPKSRINSAAFSTQHFNRLVRISHNCEINFFKSAIKSSLSRTAALMLPTRLEAPNVVQNTLVQ